MPDIVVCRKSTLTPPPPSSHFIATLSSFNALQCSLTALPPRHKAHPSTHPHHPLVLFHQLLTLRRRFLTPPPPPNSPSIHPHRHLTPICHPKTLPRLSSTHYISYSAFSLSLMPFIGPSTFSLTPFHRH